MKNKREKNKHIKVLCPVCPDNERAFCINQGGYISCFSCGKDFTKEAIETFLWLKMWIYNGALNGQSFQTKVKRYKINLKKYRYEKE